MIALLEVIATELERPRNITPQVYDHLIGTYDVTRETVGAFLSTELAKLEDYEVDLVLAPLFTPTLREQAVVARWLGVESVLPDRWADLVQQLEAKPTMARLVTEDGTTHQVRLRDVVMERFVYRLRLDGTIGPEICAIIENNGNADDQTLLKAIARRKTWETASRRQILSNYLTRVGEDFRTDDAVALLKLVETYEPADVDELLKQIPHWQQVLRQEINDSGGKPFFNERVEDLHGGGRDQRRPNHNLIVAKEQEQAFLGRLQRVLAAGTAA